MPGPMRKQKDVGVKAKNFKGTTKKLIKNYLSKYKFALMIAVIFTIGSTIFNIVGPKILGNATTEVFNGIIGKLSGGAGIDFNKIGNILLTLLVIYVLSALFSLVQGFTMASISQKITYKLRTDMSEKLSKLPMKYFDKKTNGEVLSIITNDIDTLSINLNESITQIITAVCTVIVYYFTGFIISCKMPLVFAQN